MSNNVSDQNIPKQFFQVVRYDYGDGKSGCQTVVSTHVNKPNAQLEIQESAIVYIEKQDGVGKMDGVESRILRMKDLGGSWSRVVNRVSVMPNGHYVLIDVNDHLYKWTIIKKAMVTTVISGFFGKTESEVPTVIKVFDLDIINMPTLVFSECVSMYKNRIDSLKEKPIRRTGESEESHKKRVREYKPQEQLAKDAWGKFTKNFAESGAIKLLEKGAEIEEVKDALKVQTLKKEVPNEFAKCKKASLKAKPISAEKAMFATLIQNVDEPMPVVSIPLAPTLPRRRSKGEEVKKDVSKTLAKEMMEAVKQKTGKPRKDGVKRREEKGEREKGEREKGEKEKREKEENDLLDEFAI